MTRDREFKALVRERMAKTGERYTAARAHLLTARQGPAPRATPQEPGLLPGYSRCGGIQGDTGALTNALRHAGVRSSTSGEAYGEAVVNGLCGGPGFLYAVFEYRGMPPLLTMAMRSRSMSDAFVGAGLPRLGGRYTTSETSSAKAAQRALDEALAAGKAPLCVVDIASLPWLGLPPEYVGGAPHVVAVAGRDGDSLWIDDRASRPLRIDGEAFAAARARSRAAKHRLIRFEGPDIAHDTRRAMLDAIADTARSYSHPAVPKSFAANCGFSGLARWRMALVDQKDKRAWPTLFGEGPAAYIGLQRAYECIELQFTAPAAGRALYADFLDEAARALSRPMLEAAARSYREAGAAWSALANEIANSDATIRLGCELADCRVELSDGVGEPPSKESKELWRQRRELGATCQLSRASAAALYGKLAEGVTSIIEAERAAVGLLERATAS